MTGESWSRTLDRIEADLAAIEDAIERGTAAPFRPPAEIPTEPMPAELGNRAEALLGRNRRLEARAADHLEGIQAGLRALAGRRPPAPTATGRIVDVGA